MRKKKKKKNHVEKHGTELRLTLAELGRARIIDYYVNLWPTCSSRKVIERETEREREIRESEYTWTIEPSRKSRIVGNKSNDYSYRIRYRYRYRAREKMRNEAAIRLAAITM